MRSKPPSLALVQSSCSLVLAGTRSSHGTPYYSSETTDEFSALPQKPVNSTTSHADLPGSVGSSRLTRTTTLSSSLLRGLWELYWLEVSVKSQGALCGQGHGDEADEKRDRQG